MLAITPLSLPLSLRHHYAIIMVTLPPLLRDYAIVITRSDYAIFAEMMPRA